MHLHIDLCVILRIKRPHWKNAMVGFQDITIKWMPLKCIMWCDSGDYILACRQSRWYVYYYDIKTRPILYSIMCVMPDGYYMHIYCNQQHVPLSKAVNHHGHSYVYIKICLQLLSVAKMAVYNWCWLMSRNWRKKPNNSEY